jgi:addiction module RelE/StbE family toxin
MIVRFHKNFDRQYKKLRKNEREKFKERIVVFLQDEFNPMLNNHPLKGKYEGYRSINISGDLRAVYKLVAKDLVLFSAIDTHSNLYK